MKQCRYCSNWQDDAVQVCTVCHQAFSAAPPPVTAPYYYAKPVCAATPITAGIKQAGRSPLFLLTAIFFSLNMLFGAASSFFSRNYVSDLILSLFGDWLPYDVYSSFSSGYDGSFWIGLIFSLAISSLPVIGMWLFYGSCASKREGFKTGGLTMIQTIAIIGMVVVSLGIAGVIILFVLVGLARSAFGGYDFNVAPFLFVLLAIILVAFVFVIMYFASISGVVGRAKRAWRGHPVPKQSSMFLAVMHFIFAFFTFLGAVGTLVDGLVSVSGFFTRGNFLFTLFESASLLLSGLAMLFSACFLIRLRSLTRAFIPVPQYQQPAYAQPYPAPVPPVPTPVIVPAAPVPPSPPEPKPEPEPAPELKPAYPPASEPEPAPEPADDPAGRDDLDAPPESEVPPAPEPAPELAPAPPPEPTPPPVPASPEPAPAAAFSSKFCIHCGTPFKEDNRFCINCGKQRT